MSVRIDSTVPKLMPTTLPMLLRSPITHNQDVHDLQHFHQRWLDRLSFSTLPLVNSAAHFFYCAIRKRLLPKGFHEAFIFLRRHSFLTEVLDNRSDLKFLHFANVSHPPLLKVLYISNQAWPHAFHTPIVLQLDQMTKWKSFKSMNLNEAYRAKNLLITPRRMESS